MSKLDRKIEILFFAGLTIMSILSVISFVISII